MARKHLFVLLLILFFPVSTVFAQISSKGLPIIHNYTPYEYTGAAQNWGITQDQRGIMYFANGHGVIEYDGSSWDIIPITNRSQAHSITKSANGRIFVGGQMEFGQLRPNKFGKVTYRSLLQLVPEQYRNFEDVKNTYFTDDGIIFLSDKKIFIFKNYQIKRVVRTPTRFQNGFYANHKFYTLEEEYGLCQFKNNKLQLLPQGDSFKNDKLHLILRFDHNKIIIVTRDRGFLLFDGVNYTPIKIGKSSEILKASPTCGNNLGIDQFIIGTKHNGIYVINKKGENIQHINKERGLINNKVFDVFIDHQRNVWVALENGLSYIEFNSPFTFFNEHNGLSGSGLSSCLVNDHLYLGTTQGLYERYWGKDEIGDTVNNFALIEEAKDPTFYLEKIDNSILIGHQHGTYLLNTKNNSLEKISDKQVGYKTLDLQYHEDYIVEGTNEGILLFKRTDKGRVHFVRKIKGFDESCKYIEEIDATTFWVSHDNKGIWKIKLNEDLTQVIEVNVYTEESGLPNHIMNKVFKIHGEIIFSTSDGIYKFNNKTNRFYEDTVLTKYIGKLYINKLFQDQKANIWFETGLYDTLKSKLTYHVGMLKRTGGNQYKLVDTEFKKFKGKNLDYVASIDANHIILGMEEGFIHYNYRYSKNLKAPYHSIIREVSMIQSKNDSLIFGGSFVDNEGNTILTQPFQERDIKHRAEYVLQIDSLIEHNKQKIEELSKKGDPEYQIRSHLEEIAQLKRKKKKLMKEWGSRHKKFPHTMNSFRFRFTSDFYEDCNKNEYRFKLTNISYPLLGDQEWSDWSRETHKEYTHLQPGKYEFQVICKNIYDHQSEIATYEFEIKPPWYDTLWFHSILVSFLVLLMVISFYFNRRKKLNKFTFVLTLFTIITVFETVIEIVEKKLENYHGGVLVFTIIMNIMLAMSLNPIENYIRKSFRKKHLSHQQKQED